MPLLTNNAWRIALSGYIDAANDAVGGKLAAFVYMPEHVHLLVWGLTRKEQVSELLSRLKRSLSVEVRADLEARNSRLLEKLVIQERPDRTVFRFWQEGPGFDRNLFTVKAVLASIEYIHHNPVKRGLCVRARDWRWSSARFYERDCLIQDAGLPTITPLPAEFWS
jgi:putative transposase